MRVTLSLLRLKRAYPERVSLLLGNRDINKMRLTSELAPSELSFDALPRIPPPAWLPPSKRVTPLAELTSLAAQRLGVREEEVPSSEIAASNTLAARLRWILKHTMGADGELERRAAELSLIEQREVSEEEAAASFVASVGPGGWTRELLRVGELVVVVNSNLFLHGGLVGTYAGGASHCLGVVPGGREVGGVHSWASELNCWLRRQLTEWEQRPRWDHSSAGAYAAGRRGGNAAMEYVLPTSPPSVVMGRHLTPSGMPAPLPADLVRRLNAGGITRLVVGHTPHGNCPTVMKSFPEGGGAVEVVMADTSYSDMSAEDNRGEAVSELVLLPDGSARVHGVLHDGTRIDFCLSKNVADPSEYVGRYEPDGRAGGGGETRFAKAVLCDGRILMCRVRGFETTYETISKQRAKQLFEGGEESLSPMIGRRRITRQFTTFGDEECIGLSPFFDKHRAQVIRHFFERTDLDGSLTITREELRKVCSCNVWICPPLPAWDLLIPSLGLRMCRR